MDLGELKSPKTTSEQIADALRTAILNGTLHSGQPLRQDEIAKSFDVSKIPVREALSKLEVEGLVETRHNRGYFVTNLSFQDVDEIYAIRIALELMAFRRAISALTPADLAIAEAILAEIDQEKNVVRWAELNWEFHKTLYQACKMPRLLKMVEALHTNVARFLQLSELGNLAYLGNSQKEHYALLELCRQRETDAACDLLQKHLSGPVSYLAELMPISDWT